MSLYCLDRNRSEHLWKGGGRGRGSRIRDNGLPGDMGCYNLAVSKERTNTLLKFSKSYSDQLNRNISRIIGHHNDLSSRASFQKGLSQFFINIDFVIQ